MPDPVQAMGGGGPSGVAGPADVQVLGSPLGSLGTSGTVVLTSGNIVIGPSGKVLVRVMFSVKVTVVSDGVHAWLTNDTDTTIVYPKNEGANTSQMIVTRTDGSFPFVIEGYQSGLSGSKVFKFIANDAAGVSTTTVIEDAVMTIWTW